MKNWIGLILFWAISAEGATGLFNNQSSNYGQGLLRVEDQRLLAVHGRGQPSAAMLADGQSVNINIAESSGYAFLFVQRAMERELTIAVPQSSIRRNNKSFYISGSDMLPAQIFDLRGEVRTLPVAGTQSRFASEKSCNYPIESRSVVFGRERYCGDRRMTANETTCRGVFNEHNISEQIQQGISLTILRREDGKEIGKVQTRPVPATKVTRSHTTACQVAKEFDPARPAGTSTWPERITAQ